MNVNTNEEAETDNVVDFAVAKSKIQSGGGNPPSNWLVNLKEGTRFLAQYRNNSNSLLMEFIIGMDPRLFKAVFLGYEQPQGFGFRWHDPVRFCQEFAYFDTIKIETSNDGSEVHEGTVEGDGKSEVVDPDDDKK